MYKKQACLISYVTQIRVYIRMISSEWSFMLGELTIWIENPLLFPVSNPDYVIPCATLPIVDNCLQKH